ncbi:hypothetical protein E2C01_041693 [Portunus trituberculatus]|uniref:Uncharacterized protein n=1 Tax=Portunus trituberculatus TaxID=210409 RepID=A0A5B7FKK2_PORTR|nr:hypothetical protein [Portunus trituberculatus]
MRIEKVGGNREGATVSCFRQLCFDEEKKMRFSRGEVVFHRLEIRSTNVAEVNEENVEGSVKTFPVINEQNSPTWEHFWSLPQKGTPRLDLELPS